MSLRRSRPGGIRRFPQVRPHFFLCWLRCEAMRCDETPLKLKKYLKCDHVLRGDFAPALTFLWPVCADLRRQLVVRLLIRDAVERPNILEHALQVVALVDLRFRLVQRPLDVLLHDQIIFSAAFTSHAL